MMAFSNRNTAFKYSTFSRRSACSFIDDTDGGNGGNGGGDCGNDGNDGGDGGNDGGDGGNEDSGDEAAVDMGEEGGKDDVGVMAVASDALAPDAPGEVTVGEAGSTVG